ncbi:hypothetical protein [Streptomyces sp. NPDC089799]|uniref:hypothetical protein n=1 Tax=Streptomyces sp. NPDC089799 TaxID=3155066 RepID=UPI00341F15C0
MSDALTTAGLVDYGTEWWHRSFVERCWALMTGEAAALCGPASRQSTRHDRPREPVVVRPGVVVPVGQTMSSAISACSRALP